MPLLLSRINYEMNSIALDKSKRNQAFATERIFLLA